MVRRVLLASPRGYCAGVERAVDTVELALERFGAPVYVRKQIVHNAHVVRELEARGAVFVDTEEEAPPGATIVFSAHGVAPSVHEASAARGHNVIEATVLVQDVAEAEALALPPDAKLAYITQTTLSVDETSQIIGILRRRFPTI